MIIIVIVVYIDLYIVSSRRYRALITKVTRGTTVHAEDMHDLEPTRNSQVLSEEHSELEKSIVIYKFVKISQMKAINYIHKTEW